jgi:hypothetical protein
VVHKSSPLGEMKRSALLRECIIGSDAAVPAASLPSLKIWRELDRKSSISVILFLKSHAVPGMTVERVCIESSVFPIIVIVALLVEGQPVSGAVPRYIGPSNDGLIYGSMSRRFDGF